MIEGEKENLTVAVKPTNIINGDVTWETTDAEIAEVDVFGKVTAVKEGNIYKRM